MHGAPELLLSDELPEGPEELDSESSVVELVDELDELVVGGAVELVDMSTPVEESATPVEPPVVTSASSGVPSSPQPTVSASTANATRHGTAS